ncbi:hypothetical protein ACJIZ3_006042 [Penstemon smallii]|uniref:Uncharacterized protein n=1 Tax=Penstemon smallii TaxID=265156 RepID=A0ABD3S6Q0_9LAMI
MLKAYTHLKFLNYFILRCARLMIAKWRFGMNKKAKLWGASCLGMNKKAQLDRNLTEIPYIKIVTKHIGKKKTPNLSKQTRKEKKTQAFIQ